DSEKLKLDLAKAIKYALIHDFVEVYAGDTYFYGNRKGKTARERRAAARIKKEFPEFKELHRLIEAYESKRDRESRFVYALDKIVPLYNVYLDNGRYWKKADVSLKILFDKKKSKVAKSPELVKYFDEMVALLRKEEGRLFRKSS
ncbi:MAG TPA: HD domain-containing protein, partial [Candidatus Paceibacterota bacterium]|nr:HD domain-containing protein [Candidatus Paceibacterota bacterium]